VANTVRSLDTSVAGLCLDGASVVGMLQRLFVQLSSWVNIECWVSVEQASTTREGGPFRLKSCQGDKPHLPVQDYRAQIRLVCEAWNVCRPQTENHDTCWANGGFKATTLVKFSWSLASGLGGPGPGVAVTSGTFFFFLIQMSIPLTTTGGKGALTQGIH